MNPIPWAIVLLLGLLITAFFLYPNARTWALQRAEIHEFRQEIPLLTSALQATQKEQNMLSVTRQEANKDIQTQVQQRLPKQIDTGKIAQLLELFALQLNLDLRHEIQIDKVTFGDTHTAEKADYSTVQMVIQTTVNEASLRALVEYLQSSELPKILENQYNNGLMNTAEYALLSDTLLPIITIDTLELQYGRTAGDPIQVKIITQVYQKKAQEE